MRAPVLMSAFSLMVLLGVAHFCRGQVPDRFESLPPAQSTKVEQTAELDDAVTSLEGAISIQPPLGGELIRQDPGAASDELFRVVGPEREWSFVVSRINLHQPMPLVRTEKVELTGQRVQVDGFIDVAARQMSSETPGTLLRTELVPIAGVNGAMLASRFNDPVSPGRKKLMQQAVIGRTENVYYIVTFISPVGAGPVEQDEQARLAVSVFESSVGSIKLINASDIRRDQDERLLRTRALLVNWTESRQRQALVPERWVRIQKDGKDVGYSYIVEEVAGGLPKAGGGGANAQAQGLGIRVGIRTRLILPGQPRVDTEVWMWNRFDRAEEMFASVSVLSDADNKAINWSREVGRSIKFTQVERDARVRDQANQGMTKVEVYALDVTVEGKESSSPPSRQQLPPFYIPQALAHLLPRLVPLNSPDTFALAVYMSDTRRVMMQYVDVLPQQQVNLGGRSVEAVPVRIRLGLEGVATTHYLSADGAWMGSLQENSKILMFPATAKELTAIWKDADLSRPGEVK